MVAQLDLKPHKFEMRKGEPIHVKTVPYVRLCARTEDGMTQEVYIQGGQFFSGENTPPIKKADLPEWVAAEVARISPEVRREVGLKD